ncbi:hypothetical protein TELCIR_09524 [Teladorsagia circumcincta]|uniref:Calponin-homology (CH) domain-containing protein n=1 Tax=Teladorsagia circumcincta TaxID=45464 RepID=A0A2G9UEI5_TELCI|nr:hypothetical protein TELCIR_09524 [Teladorsagia circumcincta]
MMKINGEMLKITRDEVRYKGIEPVTQNQQIFEKGATKCHWCQKINTEADPNGTFTGWPSKEQGSVERRRVEYRYRSETRVDSEELEKREQLEQWLLQQPISTRKLDQSDRQSCSLDENISEDLKANLAADHMYEIKPHARPHARWKEWKLNDCEMTILSSHRRSLKELKGVYACFLVLSPKNPAECKVNDLFVDLRDGFSLIALLEVLTGDRLET